MLHSISNDTGSITAVAFSPNLEPLPIHKVEDHVTKVKLRENNILISLSDEGELVAQRLMGGRLWNDENVDVVKKIMQKYDAVGFEDLALLYDDGGPTTFNGLSERSLSKIWRAVNLFKAVGMVKAFNLGTKSVEVPFQKVPNEWHLAKDIKTLTFGDVTKNTVYFVCWTKCDRAQVYANLRYIPNGVYKIAKVDEGPRHVSWELFVDMNKYKQVEGTE